jgi:hypothetical protein
MDNKNEIALNNIFDRVLVVICLAILVLIFIQSEHLFTLRIDSWIESFERKQYLWVKLLFYWAIIAVFGILSFRVPHKVVLTEDEVRVHMMFSEPQTIKWEDISRFEIITNKRYKSQISLLIESVHFSTEICWPKKRPGFSFEVSVIIDKARVLAERKMIRELADNSSIHPDKRSKFGEDINS